MTVAQGRSSPHAKLTLVGMADVRWTGGFWADRWACCRDVMVPNMWRLISDPQISHIWENFLVAAGIQEGRFRGPRWQDGDLYKWREAAAWVYGLARDAELDARLDEVIAMIARVQRPVGYIHTPVIIAHDRLGQDAAPFHDRMDFEMYNMGHLMTAACAHHEATGKRALLDVAEKAAVFLAETFRAPTAELARNAVCPSHYMGLADLYRTTGKREYLELAVKLLEMRALVQGGGDDNQDRIPFRQQTVALGHAVRANYLLAGVADVFSETGDPTLLGPLEAVWRSVVFHKMHITGGCGALYDGASHDGAKDQAVITRVHQAYGREYQLPNLTAHNETCANIGQALWNWRMLRLTGEARFADVLERVLYNSMLSGISLDGKRFFYTNALRRVAQMPFELRWSRTREPFLSCFCCPPNVVRMIAQSGRWAYSTSPDGLWVHLYGGNVLATQLPDGSAVTLTQQSDYPWDGAVKITIEAGPKRAFGLMLRIPGWAESASVKVNGRQVDQKIAVGEYLRLERTWSAGDVVALDLPMPARLIEAHPLAEETRNQVAVMRGPVVYCLESVDLPAGVRVDEVVIPRDIALRPQPAGDLAGLMKGIVALEGQAMAAEAGDWSGALYRPVRQRQLRPVPIRLVPYFAWDNRGMGEMAVWLPAS
ncbi:MAG: glycoside hydrolase family 127 protein [Phycisphaerae bacterium]|nr:glycoside hydrolase family 127 protein [Phycisphaerae bacterium]